MVAHSLNTNIADTRYTQVAEHVRQLIQRSLLRPGMRVPSVRHLSRQQKVSVSTVQAAYRLLEREELIQSRPRSGYFVRHARTPLAEPAITRPALRPRLMTVSEHVLAVLRSDSDRTLVPLGVAIPNPALLPVKTLARLMGRVARQYSEECLAYDSLPGCRRFREQIARRAIEAGCVIDASEIVATTGTMEALHLALRAVTAPGDVVAVESPAFFGTLQLLQSLGLRVLEIPTHPRHGVVVDKVRQAIERHPVKACLFNLNFQNPLGCSVSDADKKQLVDLLATHQIPLIEDDIYGELHFTGSRPRAARAFDTKGLVLWCGSLSKTVAPGLRAGWIAAGKFSSEVERLKSIQSLSSPPSTLLVAAEYLASGQFDRHLVRLRSVVAQNVRRLTCFIAEHFPAGTQVAEPAGGMSVWVELPAPIDTMTLHHLALQQGVGIAPGPIFSATGQYRNCMRLSVGMKWDDRIDRALAQVALLAKQLLAAG